ncbi:unnamed protein product, partial [Ceratitis capitata]
DEDFEQICAVVDSMVTVLYETSTGGEIISKDSSDLLSHIRTFNAELDTVFIAENVILRFTFMMHVSVKISHDA